MKWQNILFRIIFVYFVLFSDSDCARITTQQRIDAIGIYYYSPLRKREISMKNLNSALPGFDVKLPTKIIIHGWFSDRNHISIAPLKNAYLTKGNVNVLSVDWGLLSSLNYDVARNFVPTATLNIYRILRNFFERMSIELNNVHILGHSLGAHISGGIGKHFNGKIGRITGLDPAGPLFTSLSEDSINSNDAQFVDTIHTDIGVFGQIKNLSHADFYPNRGLPPQPGCKALDIITTTSCSHYRAPLLYAESILLPGQFIAAPCDINSLFNSIKLCKPKYHYPSKIENIVYMGENLSRKARGIYYLETNAVAPYGRGNYLIL